MTRDERARATAHDALQEAETRFRIAFENAPIGMALLTLEGRFLLVNEALCDLLGRSPDELLSVTWRDVTPPDEVLSQEAQIRDVIAGRHPGFETERQYFRSDGTEIWGALDLSVVNDSKGEPAYLIAQLVDITQRKRAEEEAGQALASAEQARAQMARQARELGALQETTLDLIRRLEPTSLLEVILTRAAGLMGTTHAYLYVADESTDELVVRVGTGLFGKYVGYRLRRGDGLAGRVWETGEPLAIDDYRTWSGRRPEFGFIRAAAALPLRAGQEVVGVIGLVHLQEGRAFSPEDLDLLTRLGRLASVALENARLYSELQQELAERSRAEKELERFATELQQANEELRQADELKSHFVAVASHEFRTPLTSVLGFTNTLLRKWEELGDDEKKYQLSIIFEQAERLSRLVDELLTMSKIEAGALEVRPTPIPVRTAAERVVSTFGDDGTGIDIVVPNDLRVVSDPDHLQQILTNYVANALSHGEAPIGIEADSHDGWVEILV
ncbi:MAG TPA: PAS domain S-box protein, partial [Actinomycetota bacterium]|nr:PAS domain S-box protein [Actinomycetota bacterium]